MKFEPQHSVIFIFLLFLSTVMSANEVETKEKQKLPEIKKLTATYIYEGISFD